MTFLWENYDSFPRIFYIYNYLEPLVDSEPSPQFCAVNAEVLVLDKTGLQFKTDGYSTKIDVEKSRLALLHTGDICTIDSRGVGQLIYNATGDDACIYVTGHCNSNCVMCPSSDNERRYDNGYSDDWLVRYIAMLPENLSHITVTGGEPTLRTEAFFTVMRLLADKFPEVEVLLLTNGRSFSLHSIFNRLIDYCPQYLRVAIPLHGSSAEIHDAITQAPKSFFQTRDGIRNLLSENIAVELRVVVSKMNATDLQNIAKMIARDFHDVLVVNFIGLETRGNCAKNFSKTFIDMPVAANAITAAIDILIHEGIDAAIYNFPLCYVNPRYWSICRKSISPEKIRYADECCKCEAKGFCGGFFNTTLSMTKPEVNPIQFGKQSEDKTNG